MFVLSQWKFFFRVNLVDFHFNDYSSTSLCTHRWHWSGARSGQEWVHFDAITIRWSSRTTWSATFNSFSKYLKRSKSTNEIENTKNRCHLLVSPTNHHLQRAAVGRHHCGGYQREYRCSSKSLFRFSIDCGGWQCEQSLSEEGFHCSWFRFVIRRININSSSIEQRLARTRFEPTRTKTLFEWWTYTQTCTERRRRKTSLVTKCWIWQTKAKLGMRRVVLQRSIHHCKWFEHQ